jgi:VWFA-related protein
VIGRPVVLLAALGAAGAALAAQAPVQGQPPSPGPKLQTFRAVTASVAVDVVVLRGRSPVGGLTPKDFALTDNGVPQQIDSVSSAQLPIDVSLAIDVSGSVISNFKAFKTEVRRFARMLRPTDRIRIVAFGTNVVEAVRMRPAGDELDLDALETQEVTSLNDALLYTLLWPAGEQRRHLVIVLTDGVDTVSTMSGAAVVAAAARVEAVVHALLVPPVSEPTVLWQRRSVDAIRELAFNTGGNIHTLKQASHDFKEIVDDFRSGYVLRFTPDKVAADGLHELSVTIARPNANRYTVRARKSYIGDRKDER